MKYVLEIYASSMGEGVEKIEVDGVGFIVTDTCEGALFTVIGRRGSPMFAVPYGRLKSFRKLDQAAHKAANIVDIKRQKA